MLLLFVDTETSGLDPLDCQIIEIGGVIINFDTNSLSGTVVSTYDSLVKIRLNLDPKITRITGLDETDLQQAPNLELVQEEWIAWINPYLTEISCIIGHSINFDLGFLNHEGWLLPENYRLVDTLDISKILYPQVAAVNLEHLIEWLNIQPEKTIQIPQGVTIKPHRALYDTISCFSIFLHSMNALARLQAPQEFYSTILQQFIPLPITFYSKSIPSDLNATEAQSSNFVSVDITGSPLPLTLFELLKQHVKSTHLEIITSLLTYQFSTELARIICQLYVILNYKLNSNPDWNYKVHARLSREFLTAQLLLSWVFSTNLPTTNHTVAKFSVLENILLNLKNGAEYHMVIGQSVDVAELLKEVLKSQNIHTQIQNDIEQISNKYAFLVVSLQTLFSNPEIIYDPYDPETIINHTQISKLLDLIESLNKLVEDLSQLDEDPNSLVYFLINSLQSRWQSTIPPQNKKLFLQFYKQSLTVNWEKEQYSLLETIRNLSTDYTQVEIPTYLESSAVVEFCKILKIEQILEIPNVTIESRFLPHESTCFSGINLPEYIANNLVLAKQEKKPVIILCGQNSGLKDSERILVEKYQPSEYLVLGESGSLAKIGSKLTRGFAGIFVSKVGDFEYLNRLDLPKLHSIVVLGEPYIYIHHSLNSTLDKETIKQLKKLYRIGIISRLNNYTNGSTPITFISSYAI